MKLKNTVRILMDTNNINEVPGEIITYEYKGNTFQLIVHESVQPWTPNVLDISEYTTGCRCTSTNKSVQNSNKSDIIQAMNKFIVDKGLTNFLEQIKIRSLTR